MSIVNSISHWYIMVVGVSTYSLTVTLHNMSMNVYSYSVVGMVDNVILLTATTERDNNIVIGLLDCV